MKLDINEKLPGISWRSLQQLFLLHIEQRRVKERAESGQGKVHGRVMGWI